MVIIRTGTGHMDVLPGHVATFAELKPDIIAVEAVPLGHVYASLVQKGLAEFTQKLNSASTYLEKAEAQIGVDVPMSSTLLSLASFTSLCVIVDLCTSSTMGFVRGFWRLSVLGTDIVAVFALAYGPFVYHGQLCPLPVQEAEKHLSDMVVSKAIVAKIERPVGIVCFQTAKDSNNVLNSWAMNLEKLVDLVEKSCHQIHKETVVHKASLKA
ncbi:hypothetical protein ACFX10_040233 [Malus domestica]